MDDQQLVVKGVTDPGRLIRCHLCGEDKPMKLFTKGKDGRPRRPCKQCSSDRQMARWAKNPQIRTAQINYYVVRNEEHRRAVFEHYGQRCVCCGETNQKFLTVDHIEQVGGAEKKRLKQSRMNYWLFRNNFPPGYRIMCYNCNCGRARNGGICPHQESSEAIAQASSSKRSETPDVLTKHDDMVQSLPKGKADFVDFHDNPAWPLTDRVQ